MNVVTRIPNGRQLNDGEARSLTDSIRRDTQAVWVLLLGALEGNVRGVLGYSSWSDYCAAEFNFSKSRAYRNLQAARVWEVIEADRSPMCDSAITSERVACEFAPLRSDPEPLREAHAQVLEDSPRDGEHPATVTASQVRAVVGHKRAARPSREDQTVAPPLQPSDDFAPPEQLTCLVGDLRIAIEIDPTRARRTLQRLKRDVSRRLFGPATHGLLFCIGT